MTTTERLCPEADERDQLDDGAFWDRVAASLGLNVQEREEEPDCDPQVRLEPCDICGSDSACGYDAEGRPLIHATDPEQDRDSTEGWPT
jgi:hypothetical protein